MKVDAENPKYFSLLEYPGEIVVAVRKRAEWETELDMTQSELGQEGAWYIDRDDRTHVPLKPFFEDGEGEKGNWRSLLFRLRPPDRSEAEGKLPMGMLYEHRFLFRFWNTDVYVPRIESVLFLLVRHMSENWDGPVWELRTPAATLYGIAVDGPPV
jgi:hypothetical protein